MNRKQTISIMVNEEDHLRMQAIQPGLQLLRAFQSLDTIDSELEAQLSEAEGQAARVGELESQVSELEAQAALDATPQPWRGEMPSMSSKTAGWSTSISWSSWSV